MFDSTGRLPICNERYLEIYRLSPDVVNPGANADRYRPASRPRPAACNAIRSTIAPTWWRLAAGKDASFVAELARRPVHFRGQPPHPHRRYWIGTHHDITERRKAEQKSLLLSEQEARRAVSRGCHRLVSRQRRRRAQDRDRKRRDDEIDRHGAVDHVERHHRADDGAVRTSNDAFNGVESAAAAADELSKSIAEINRQLVSASDVVGAATAEAQTTNTVISGLRQAAQKIDDVVKLIKASPGRPICWRSMPRSKRRGPGTAGKGFAVVASEVKALAVQTAKATDVIAAQINAVQSSTQSAVRAIGSITSRMEEIRLFTSAIATSVEQQNAATGEISDNVTAAASGTRSVVGVLQKVSTAISDMHSSADTVLKASNAVEKAADSLRDSVDGFLSKVAV